MTPTTTQGGEMSLSQTLNAWYIYLYHLQSRWWFPPPSSVAISFRGYDKPRHFMGVASLPSILSWWYASKTLGFPPSGIHEGLDWDFPYSFFVVPYNPGGLVSQHPGYTVRPHWVDLGYGMCHLELTIWQVHEVIRPTWVTKLMKYTKIGRCIRAPTTWMFCDLLKTHRNS